MREVASAAWAIVQSISLMETLQAIADIDRAMFLTPAFGRDPTYGDSLHLFFTPVEEAPLIVP